MTEEEWPSFFEQTTGLNWEQTTDNSRKLRLWCVACCRRLLLGVAEVRIRKIVEMSEKFADGTAEADCLDNECKVVQIEQTYHQHPDRSAAENQAIFAISGLGLQIQPLLVFSGIANSVAEQAFSKMGAEAYEFGVEIEGVRCSRGWLEQRTAREKEFDVLADLLRDIFRPITIDPRWRTSNVVDLAQVIYDERAFDRMPILSDALMDAGCDSEEIITHCRGDGPHVRGCWVVDLLTGRE